MVCTEMDFDFEEGQPRDNDGLKGFAEQDLVLLERLRDVLNKT